MSDSRLVFSTDTLGICPSCKKALRKCKCQEANSTPAGPAHILRNTKGRGGKVVTVIEDIPLSNEALKKLSKELKKLCGVGGTLKGHTIELQGEQAEKIRVFFTKKNIPYK